jgi:hypothetical protein
LIVITRQDLPNGYQAVQGMHAAINFQHEYPEISKIWFNLSNYLAFLSSPDERGLQALLDKFQKKGLKVSAFYEPDIGNQLTAIALEPGEISRKITSHLPLALKNFK